MPARARYPAAQEAQAAGFEVARLRLADGERIQLVMARRAQNIANQGVDFRDGASNTTW